MLPKYRSMGFKIESYPIVFHMTVPKTNKIIPSELPINLQDLQIVDRRQVPADCITEYDSTICTFSRSTFLRHFFARCFKVLVAMVHGNVIGYGAIVEFPHAYAIGPLYADDDVTARHLLQRLVDAIPAGRQVCLHLLQEHSAAEELFKELGFGITNTEASYMGRQVFTKNAYHVPKHKVYCLCDSEVTIV